MDIPGLLIAAAELGVEVAIGRAGDTLVLTDRTADKSGVITPAIRAGLVASKPAILEYLRGWRAKSEGDRVPYVSFASKSLDVRYLPHDATGSPDCLIVDSRSFYRLSPAVAAWARREVERRADSMDAEQLAAARDGLAWLEWYANAIFPPHLLRVAHRTRAELPHVPKVPSLPDWPKESYFAGWKAANSPCAN